MIHRNTERKRAIFVGHQNGKTINELDRAETNDLSFMQKH